MFGNKSHVASPSKTIRSPAPSSQPAKNNNCLLLIVSISWPEMDSMPGRSTRHQLSLLLGLPQDLRIEILARVSATSERPLADLRSLCDTCLTMRRVCSHGNVGRHLSIEGIRDEISWMWNPTAYKAFLTMLSDLGNPEACFISGIKAFFIEHRGYDDLRRAAECGHDTAAYLYAILPYRDNGGAAADDTAKVYMRRVMGAGSKTSRWLSNEGCLPLREKAARVLHYSTWRIWGEPLQPLAQVRGDQPCAGTSGCCGVEKGGFDFFVLQRRL
jgi:hypothetical protein